MRGMSRKNTDTHALHLLNPKHGRTTGGSGRSARRSSWEISGKVGCQQNYLPRNRRSTVPSKASKKNPANISPEARTSEILFQNDGGTKLPDPRLITSLFPVYLSKIKKSSLFLAAEQLNNALCCFYTPFSCKACPGIKTVYRNLLIPKPGHIAGGSRRGARRGGCAGSGRTVRQ